MPELYRNWTVDTLLYNRKEKNNSKKIIFYPKGVDISQIPNYNIIKKRQ